MPHQTITSRPELSTTPLQLPPAADAGPAGSRTNQPRTAGSSGSHLSRLHGLCSSPPGAVFSGPDVLQIDGLCPGPELRP